MAPKTIDLYGMSTQQEAVCTTAVITPGMLLARTGENGVRPHNAAGETATPAFAVEMDLTGGAIGDDYAIGDQVIYRTFQPGAGVYALAHAGGTAITVGAYLMSAGDGTLELATTSKTAIAQAREAVDNSGGSAPVRIKVEIIPAQRTAAA